jgi:uncharacterized protein (TIGR02001 family)
MQFMKWFSTLSLAGAVSVAAIAVAAAPAAADGYAVESAAAAAPASDAREFSWSITVGGTSDYVFRGVSLTSGDPAAQGSIDASYGIFYAGAWASNVDGDGYEPWELDLYAGVKPELGPVTFDFGIVGYLYPAAEDGFDYYELKAGASMEIVKNLTGGLTFWYVPSQENAPDVWTIEGSLAYTLPQMGIFEPSVSGLIGYTEDSDSTGWLYGVNDYTYWNAGLTLTVEKFSMDLRYWDSDIDPALLSAPQYRSDERFVFTAKVTLP